VIIGRLSSHRKLLAWTGGSLAVLLVTLASAGYLVYRHLNDNIAQADVRAYIGKQPADPHPKAQNILVIGSDTQPGNAGAAGQPPAQTGTLMLVHISADNQRAEVMWIPPNSWVSIPACETGNGQWSAPFQSEINQAYATGNQDGNHVAMGAACMIRTLERATSIYIDHFIVVNFAGLKDMVAALGGVYECNRTPINDPRSGLHLAAGTHLLTPAQALGYVHGRTEPGYGSDPKRIGRRQAFMSSLISQVKTELLDPVAIYEFLDAVTSALTIDTELGGIPGLYHLDESLHGIPGGKVTLFVLPSYPRADVVPSDTKSVLWTQVSDSEIFASFRNDVPVSRSLLATQGRPGKFGVAQSAAPGTSRNIPVRTASQSICAD
jgi:LCP family protein required for cell wall assembly